MSVPSGNLGEIRRAVFDSVDWSPSASQGAKDRVNRFINRSYMKLAEQAPYLFFQDQVVVVTQPDYVGTSPDLISATADPWIITQDQTTFSGWDVDYTWDGRWLQFTGPDGVARRRQIRHVYANSDSRALSLYDPLPDSLTVGKTSPLAEAGYRIYTPEYYLPDDVISIQSMRIYDGGNTWPLTVATQDEAEERYWEDTRENITHGLPRYAYRRQHFKMPDPNTAPSVLSDHASWGDQVAPYTKPEPPGSFQYVYTLCWGFRDQTTWTHHPPTLGTTANQRIEPKWESAPSPASAVVSTASSAGHQRIKITPPDMDHITGFGGDSGTNSLRHNKGGWWYRVYRKRISVVTGYDGAVDNIDLSGAYYLLTDHVDVTDPVYDDGTIIPDYTRRLREVHGYQGFSMYPYPDKRYEIDIRCVRRPEILVDDADAPRIHLDAAELLIQGTLALLYEHLGNIALKKEAEGEYMRCLSTLAKRYGSLHPAGQVGYRKPARARSSPSRRGLRRWYNL